MDDQRFDDLARTLAVGVDRRSILRRIGAGIAALGLLGAARSVVDAAPSPCNVLCADQPGPRGAQCRQTCKACAGGPEAVCYDEVTKSFTCISITDDPSNCGGCGVVCAETYTACSGGQCVCPAGTLTCSGGGCLGACSPGTIPNGITCSCRACENIGSSSGLCVVDSDCTNLGEACPNGCCCQPAGSLEHGCSANQPDTTCCSGMCGPDGLCA